MHPIRYLLELCDTSGKHEAIAIFRADSPFPTVHVGDRFDDTGWARLDTDQRASPERPRRYTVHSIKHLVTEESGVITYRYLLNLSPFDGPSSPVWGDD